MSPRLTAGSAADPGSSRHAGPAARPSGWPIWLAQLRWILALAVLMTMRAADGMAQAEPPALSNTLDHKMHLSFGFGYGRPQRADASLSLIRLSRPDSDVPFGWFAQARPGVSAGVLAGGCGVFAFAPSFGAPPYFALSLSAALMRAWGQPIGAPSRTSFAGIEITGDVAGIRLTFGQYLKLGATTTSRARLSTWSAGVGF